MDRFDLRPPKPGSPLPVFALMVIDDAGPRGRERWMVDPNYSNSENPTVFFDLAAAQKAANAENDPKNRDGLARAGYRVIVVELVPKAPNRSRRT